MCIPAWLRSENHADTYLLAVDRTLFGFFLKRTQAEGLGRPLAAFGATLAFSPIEGMAPDSDLPSHFDCSSCCIKSHLQVQSLCSGFWFCINCILPGHFDWVSAFDGDSTGPLCTSLDISAVISKASYHLRLISYHFV